MHRGYIKTAALIGALSVALGAFAAHSLKDTISDYALGIFETAVKYQFYHVFALLAVGILYTYGKRNPLRWSGIFFILGIILFSGSLYALAFIKAAVLPGYKWVGAITPFGGLCFITGWILLFFGVSTVKKL